jgi:hypothetical protein
VCPPWFCVVVEVLYPFRLHLLGLWRDQAWFIVVCAGLLDSWVVDFPTKLGAHGLGVGCLGFSDCGCVFVPTILLTLWIWIVSLRANSHWLSHLIVGLRSSRVIFVIAKLLTHGIVDFVCGFLPSGLDIVTEEFHSAGVRIFSVFQFALGLNTLCFGLPEPRLISFTSEFLSFRRGPVCSRLRAHGIFAVPTHICSSGVVIFSSRNDTYGLKHVALGSYVLGIDPVAAKLWSTWLVVVCVGLLAIGIQHVTTSFCKTRKHYVSFWGGSTWQNGVCT